MEKNLKNLATAYVSPERSKLMAKIRSKHNKSTEIKFKMLLVRSGVKGWKMNHADLPGKPDFYFPMQNSVIFVDGCFWHGCPRCYKGTKSNQAFWNTKVASNKKRDRKNNRYYRSQGFKVIRIWEHQLKQGGAEAIKRALRTLAA